MNEDQVARSAQLALLLEVSAYPKPGNVDRTHDFVDTTYEHFIASSVAVYPVFREAAVRKERGGVGELILRGVEESMKWQRGGNTHFGAILLMIPLVMAAGAADSSDTDELRRIADGIMRNTGVEDAIALYRAFSVAKVRVRRDVAELDVMNEASIEEIRDRQLSMFDILSISASYDQISRELVGGFGKVFAYAALINEFTASRERRVNDAIVDAYLHLLAEEEDSFVRMEFGAEQSRYVKERARGIVEGGYRRDELEEFDRELIAAGINPGSSADMIAAALFIAILQGLKV